MLKRMMTGLILFFVFQSSTFASQADDIMEFFTNIEGEYSDFMNCEKEYKVVIYRFSPTYIIISPLGTGDLSVTPDRGVSAGHYGDFSIHFKRVRLTERLLSYRLEWYANMLRPKYKKDVAFHLNEWGELERFTMKVEQKDEVLSYIDCSRY